MYQFIVEASFHRVKRRFYDEKTQYKFYFLLWFDFNVNLESLLIVNREKRDRVLYVAMTTVWWLPGCISRVPCPVRVRACVYTYKKLWKNMQISTYVCVCVWREHTNTHILTGFNARMLPVDGFFVILTLTIRVTQ